MFTYPFYSPMATFPLFKKLHHNTIQTIPLHILFQSDQNYFPHSNILSTQYIPKTVHTFNTIYKIIYLNTLCIGFMFTYPFYSPMAISNYSKNYITTQFKLFHYTYYFNQIKIISLTQINFPLNIFATTVHTLNTIYKIIYLNTLWVWVYVHIPILLPHGHFPPVQKITSQHNSNYSTTHIISIGSKLFPSLKHTFHSIYSDNSPYTKHNLQNNLFKHILGLGLCSHTHFTHLQPFPLFKKLHHNTIQTIPLHILFQSDQNYFLHSNILSTRYIPTTIHTLNTTYQIFYLNTLWVGFMFTYPFYSPTAISPIWKIMSQHNSNYSTTHIISMGSKLFSSLKYTFHSKYSKTSPSTKYLLLT